MRIGDRLHPVLNLASARLIAGKNDPPKQVDDKFLNQLPRGPMVGIIGAPTSIHGGDDMAHVVVDGVRHHSNPRRVRERSGWPAMQTTVTRQ